MGLKKKARRVAKAALNPVAQVKKSTEMLKKTVSTVAKNKLLRTAVIGAAGIYGGGLAAGALKKGMEGYAARKQRQTELFPNLPDPDSLAIQEQAAAGNAPEITATAASSGPQYVPQRRRSLFALLFGFGRR